MRHISSGNPNDPNYDRVVEYPADSTFDGAWKISENNEISIKVVEANVIQGLANLLVVANPVTRKLGPYHSCTFKEPKQGIAHVSGFISDELDAIVDAPD